MNKMLESMKNDFNYTYTENGGLSHKTTMNGVMDLFALGGSYRSRSDEDCILLFKKAFDEDETLALKCLFYLRDLEEGAGERRFFRVVAKWLAKEHPEVMRRNFKFIPEGYGRWDDLYCLVDTPLEEEMFEFMYKQLAADVKSKTPSLLAKWLKSENSSDPETKRLAVKTRKAFLMTAKQYRKTLSTLRERIRVLEKLMSSQRWDEIDFSKIPSKAGMRYRNAFAKNEATREAYQAFAANKKTKVNAGALFPCDVIHAAIDYDRNGHTNDLYDSTRLMINKYWENLKDFFHNATFNGVAVVDTSASMLGMYGSASSKGVKPMDVAIALGLYCSTKCNPDSPWYNHYISFSRNARLVEVEGVDLVDKVRRIYRTNVCENTNIESVFKLILDTAIQNNLSQKDIPENVIIISDMEFDAATSCYYSTRFRFDIETNTVLESYAKWFEQAGYKCPKIVFWNVNARENLIPAQGERMSFVSGYSANIFESLLTGKTGWDMVLNKLLSERYEKIK